MTRIGMFTYSTQPRGSVVHAACLSEELTRQGHDVTLFALEKGGGGFFRDVACKVCLIPAAEAPANMDELIAQRIGELSQGLLARAPELDVLHAQDCLVASALLELRRGPSSLSQCPLVRTVHHVERFESPYLAECQRRSILGADVVLSVSRMTAEDVLRAFERPSIQVSNGVDGARFDRASAPPRAELRQRLGLPEGAVVVLSVGGVEQRKNSVRCLAAFAAAAREVPELFWVIAGGASVLDHKAYVARFDDDLAALPAALSRRIQRTGTLPEATLTDLYLASDVLLGASEHEGFGLSVLEAMAASVPTIVPRRPPFTEYVPEHAARFVDPDCPASIAEALVELCRSPALRARLTEAGPKVAREFSWQRSATEHARVYAQALERVSSRALPPRATAEAAPARRAI